MSHKYSAIELYCQTFEVTRLDMIYSVIFEYLISSLGYEAPSELLFVILCSHFSIFNEQGNFLCLILQKFMECG